MNSKFFKLFDERVTNQIYYILPLTTTRGTKPTRNKRRCVNVL